jgi:dihydrofolate synthase/folylpolyglutamate synthase
MIRTYQAALDYLYSFIDPTRKGAATVAEAVRNLDRVRALLAAAGDPQGGLNTVVVAGTKGKGSTCALLEAIVRSAGLRTGLWTSPHLNSYRERIQIDREPISQAELIALVEGLRPVIERFDTATYGRPTTFDVGFVLALRHFAARGVQLAVIEVGLGGRYDAANVLTPLVSAISSISYDHMAILGPSLAEIADNKAGIMKPGVPCVSVPQAPEAAAVIKRVSAEVGAPLYLAELASLAPASATAAAAPYPAEPRPQHLRGAFQEENARLAMGAALLLRERGLPLSDMAIAEGLASARWPGRFELVEGTPPVLIDGAHNGDSAEKLAAAMKADLRYNRLVLVLGTSRDKDIAAIAAALLPLAAAVVITRSGHPRSMDIDRIATVIAPYLRGPLVISTDVAAAIDTARELAGPHDLICVTGSLFVVGAAREALRLAVSD